jgi:hypothetical protein
MYQSKKSVCWYVTKRSIYTVEGVKPHLLGIFSSPFGEEIKNKKEKKYKEALYVKLASSKIQEIRITIKSRMNKYEKELYKTKKSE